jgi:hypothetical protein
MTAVSDHRLTKMVEARLGRAPQDSLEAAVVLEAWFGVPACEALPMGEDIAASGSGSQPAKSSGTTIPQPQPPRHRALEAFAFVLAIVAIAGWAEPMAADFGLIALERALAVALPLGLAVQWAINARFLSRPGGLAQLGRRARPLLLGATVVTVVLVALLGWAGLVAATLAAIWASGVVLARDDRTFLYGGLVIAGTAAMQAGIPSAAVLAVLAAVTVGAAFLVVRGEPDEPASTPGGSMRTTIAAAVGLGIGILLVVDRSVGWSLGSVTAVGLLPSAIASAWGGLHLAQIHSAIPRALSGIAVLGHGHGDLVRGPLILLSGALARVVLAAAALTVLVVSGAELIGAETSGITVLIGFGLVAVATLLVSLLESIGWAGWALAAVAAAVLVAAMASLIGTGVPGLALALGATVAILLALPAVIAALSRPATILATRLYVR